MTVDLIASFDFQTDFNGINRHYPYLSYPAGIYDGDKYQYKYGPKSIEYPTLTLPAELYDKFGDSIGAGFYTVIISNDRKYLNLYEGNDLKARIKIVKLVEEMKTQDELNKEAELLGRIETAKSKKKLKKLKKAQEDYEAFLAEEAAKNFVRIEDTGKGYYSITYYCFGIKAEGIIQK